MVASTARLRERPVIAAQIAALSTEVGGRDVERFDFARGALDALEWVTHGGPGPLTGASAVVPVTVKLVVGELATAEDIIYGRPSRHREYARGVEHALMWAQFATAAPPVRPPGPDARRPAPSAGQAPSAGPRRP